MGMIVVTLQWSRSNEYVSCVPNIMTMFVT